MKLGHAGTGVPAIQMPEDRHQCAIIGIIEFMKIRWRVKLKAVVCLESLAKSPKL